MENILNSYFFVTENYKFVSPNIFTGLVFFFFFLASVKANIFDRYFDKYFYKTNLVIKVVPIYDYFTFSTKFRCCKIVGFL